MNPYLDSPEKAAPNADPSLQSLKARLKGQKAFEPAVPTKDRLITGIKPSPPRDVPSQEQIAAAQNEWDPDNYHERPPDTTFLHHFNSPAKRKDSVEVQQPLASNEVPAAVTADKSYSVKSSKVPDKPSTNVSEDKAVPFSKHARTSSKTFEIIPKDNKETIEKTSTEKPLPKVENDVQRPQTPDTAVDKQTLSPTVEPAEVSPASDYHSASSTLHPLKATGKDEIKFPTQPTIEEPVKTSIDSQITDSTRPSSSNIQQAKSIFEGDESVALKENAAAWLGEPNPERALVRQAYMDLFDWQNLNILAALRDLCSRLYLKGEAQQVDRLLDAFSTRWCACNSEHGFKAIGQ